MPEPDLIELFAHPLYQAQIRCFVTGSVAAMLYGEPRVTHDIDFVVFLRVEDVSRLSSIFPAPVFYVPPVAVILEEIARETIGHFNILHIESGLKADFYPAGRDELHAWAFRHLRQYVIGTQPISLAPPEYIILRKLQYLRDGGSEKHLRDIRSLLAISGELLDRSALAGWLNRLELNEEWRKATA
jgi:hypothetical protein